MGRTSCFCEGGKGKVKRLFAVLAVVFLLYNIRPVGDRVRQYFPQLPVLWRLELPEIRVQWSMEEEPEAEQVLAEQPEEPSEDWRLILVNSSHEIQQDFVPELETIRPGEPYQADSRIVGSVRAMMEAAMADGINLKICSAYRSYDRQKAIWKTASPIMSLPDTAPDRLRP